MRTGKNVIFFMVAFTMFGCLSRKHQITPDPLSSQENIVLVPSAVDGKGYLTALDGQTGSIKWEMPFYGDVKIGREKLFLNQAAYNRIEKYSDTLSLYTNAPLTKNLLTIDPFTGKSVGEVYNLLKPGFHLSCCHELQVNQLIGVENEVAFMALMFRGPFSNGSATTQKFTVYATELKTGSVKWTTDIPTTKIPAFDDLVNAMLVKDSKIYIGGMQYSLILDAQTGKTVQGFSIGKLIEPVDGNFYKTERDKVIAVDSKSGAVKWQFTRENMPLSKPAISDGVLFTAADDGKLYAFDAQTGSKKWEVQIKNANNGGFHALQVNDGLLYGTFMNGQMYAIDPGNGSIKWEAQLDLNFYVSPWNFQIRGNFVYAWDLVNRVVALDKKTGRQIWDKSMKGVFQYNYPAVFTKDN
ncbi:outer membrane protein assembly factor BamB family protein [Dyadobacter aurulentus]|uniref:outer membrane protein assembly factor BamB family protein n=1 Tax=Dyadobacter sp. UC 10 TaxID=2605428 RepID=UPI001788DCA3|nr:PQQ-binding-like beta-propeller repeat protein [Dyadobacter sp. UC 10]